jgi:hypothetical protein
MAEYRVCGGARRIVQALQELVNSVTAMRNSVRHNRRMLKNYAAR